MQDPPRGHDKLIAPVFGTKSETSPVPERCACVHGRGVQDYEIKRERVCLICSAVNGGVAHRAQINRDVPVVSGILYIYAAVGY